VASLLLLTMVFEGCSSATPPTPAPTLPPFQLLSAPTNVVEVTAVNTGAAGPLFEIPAIATSQGQLGLAMWGTEDAGVITSVTQAQVLGLGNGTNTVHIYFNGSYMPVLFVDDSSRYSIAVTNETSAHPTITLCDPNGTADATTTLTVANGVVQTGPVTAGGSCAIDTIAIASRKRMATAGPTLSDLAKLITAGSYVAGMGFAIGAILKFKAHKDNPTQVPISMPIALIFIAAALIFAPSVYNGAANVLYESSFEPINGIVPSQSSP
jgi:intracellular multiplication protein IcmD